MGKRTNKNLTVSEQLRAAIERCGLSLSQLGNECGVDSGALSRFVRGERDLTMERADKVCSRLGLRLTSDKHR